MFDPDLRQLKESRAKRLYGETYKYYVPTGVGEDFIDRIAEPGTLIDMLSAANGVGKTALAINTIAHLMFPCGSEWYDGPLFTKWPYPKRGRIVSDPATIVGTIIPEIQKWFPKGRYKSEKKGKHYEAFFTTDTGWVFDILSYDQDPKEFESATIGWIWLDEPPPESIYKACVSRLRKGGKMIITQTPIGSAAIYLYDQIVLNKDNEREGRSYMTADVESACIEHGVRGFLLHDDIVRMVSQYSEDEKQARAFGKYQHLTGLIYKQFDPLVHIIRPFKVTQQEFVVVEALDPHPRNPDAVSWLAIDPEGTKFIIDELWLKCTGGTEELAAKIKQKAQQYRLMSRIVDPSAFIVDQHTGKSLHMRLNSYGLNYLEGTKDRTYANRRIGDALNFQRVGDEIIQTPELYIFNTCQRHIFEFTHYRWDDWTGKIADKKNPKGKPIDKDDHMIENVGRLLVREPVFTPYVPHYRGSNVGEIENQDFDPYR